MPFWSFSPQSDLFPQPLWPLRASWQHQTAYPEPLTRDSSHLTFHLVVSAASLSFIDGSGLAAGFAAGRGDGADNCLIDRAIRLAFASTLITFTFTICPVFTASDGSLIYRFESSLICTSPSW